MRALLVCLSLMAAPALAQEMAELPEDQALPASIQQVLSAQDGMLDRVRRWEGDLTGDGVPDQLVQTAYAFGGNAVTLQHWIFGAAGGDFELLSSFSVPEGIKAARVEGRELVFTIYKHLPSDPMCCPSGEDEVRLILP